MIYICDQCGVKDSHCDTIYISYAWGFEVLLSLINTLQLTPNHRSGGAPRARRVRICSFDSRILRWGMLGMIPSNYKSKLSWNGAAAWMQFANSFGWQKVMDSVKVLFSGIVNSTIMVAKQISESFEAKGGLAPSNFWSLRTWCCAFRPGFQIALLDLSCLPKSKQHFKNNPWIYVYNVTRLNHIPPCLIQNPKPFFGTFRFFLGTLQLQLRFATCMG